MLENTEGAIKIDNLSCVSYAASFSGWFIFIAPSVFSNICLSCILFTLWAIKKDNLKKQAT
jgi:hypothetical protein